jgi:predicted nucleic acid-binding protein
VILVDTSVWIEHFRSPCRKLSKLLDDGQVLIHPFVLGEIACGNLKNRQEILALMAVLPSVPRADDGEILFFIEQRALMGQGIGLIDMHLLASSLMTPSLLWTFDKRLKTIAEDLRTAFVQPARKT